MAMLLIGTSIGITGCSDSDDRAGTTSTSADSTSTSAAQDSGKTYELTVTCPGTGRDCGQDGTVEMQADTDGPVALLLDLDQCGDFHMAISVDGDERANPTLGAKSKSVEVPPGDVSAGSHKLSFRASLAGTGCGNLPMQSWGMRITFPETVRATTT